MDDAALAGVGLIYNIIGLVIAGVIAYLVAKDANSRGMSGLGWGIFTFFLCIIALPVYFLVRKPRTGHPDA